MKTTAAIIALALASCVTTTTTAPDGSVTTRKEPVPGVLPFAGELIKAYSPRRIEDAPRARVINEK